MKYVVAFILLLFCFHNNADANQNEKAMPKAQKNNKAKITEHLYSKEELYEQALVLLEKNHVKQAAEKMQKLSNLYPFSDIGVKALMLSAFLYYLNGDYLDSALSSSNYIKFYPQTSDIEYMYYMRAMSMFMKIRNEFTNVDYAFKSQDYFKELLKIFPNSKYTDSAFSSLKEISEILAAHQLNIGKYYMKQGLYAAAIESLSLVSRNYKGTKIYQEAQYRMVELYCIIGVESEAKAHFALMKNEFPNSKWYRYAADNIRHCEKYAAIKTY